MTDTERLDRLEAYEAIRQIASRYAIAVDARATDLITELYVDDIRVGEERGRKALKAEFDRVLSQFRASFHQVQGHAIDFDDADHARGIVVCRADHEVGDKWVSMLIHYHDRYERRDGKWYLKGRALAIQCVSDWANDAPVGENKMRWPGHAAVPDNFHDTYPTWDAFWGDGDPPELPEGEERFIVRLRGSEKYPPPGEEFM